MDQYLDSTNYASKLKLMEKGKPFVAYRLDPNEPNLLSDVLIRKIA